MTTMRHQRVPALKETDRKNTYETASAPTDLQVDLDDDGEYQHLQRPFSVKSSQRKANPNVDNNDHDYGRLQLDKTDASDEITKTDPSREPEYATLENIDEDGAAAAAADDNNEEGREYFVLEKD